MGFRGVEITPRRGLWRPDGGISSNPPFTGRPERLFSRIRYGGVKTEEVNHR